MVSKRPVVVIVGAGFGGLATVSALKNETVDIILIDQRNHHLFQPLLYQVATAWLSPADIAAPIRGVFSQQENLMSRPSFGRAGFWRCRLPGRGAGKLGPFRYRNLGNSTSEAHGSSLETPSTRNGFLLSPQFRPRPTDHVTTKGVVPTGTRHIT